MRAAAARDTARRWVAEVASGLPEFRGAFFHGSINGMSDDAPFPSTSDVDVGVVFPDPEPRPELGKRRWNGVLIEGALISQDRLASAEQLLGDYRLGHSFRIDSIISDPFDGLRTMQQRVARHFTEPYWVLRRCEDAKNNCLKYVKSLESATPYCNQASCWLFAEGNLTHVLLAAGLQNPTVRKRYSAARELLAGAGRLDIHESLLTMLGCGAMSRSQVEHHLERMTEAFDRAASVIRSQFPFKSDLSEAARPVAVEGSRALIARGEHREAMFWIAATHARCMAVLGVDAQPEVAAAFETGFHRTLEDLGIETFADMQRRCAEIEAFLPELMGFAGALIRSGPGASPTAGGPLC